MKLCNKCNRFYEENESTNFCPYCGTKCNDEENVETEEIKIDQFELDHIENKTKYWLGLGLYFAIFYIVSTIVSLVITLIWMALNPGVEIIEGTEIYSKFYSDIASWSNFVIYVISAAVLIPITFKTIKKDFIQFKQTPGFIFKWFGFGMLIMCGGIYISSLLIGLLSFGLETGDSENQKLIVSLLKSGGINMVLMTSMTVIFAPIIEEIVFRKCLFGIFKKNTIKTVILSTIIFAGIHTIPTCLELIPSVLFGDTSWTKLYLEFIYIFQYIGQAFALSFVYHKTKGNIIPCIMIHFINNFISILATLFLY